MAKALHDMTPDEIRAQIAEWQALIDAPGGCSACKRRKYTALISQAEHELTKR